MGYLFRISIRAFTQLFDEELKEFTQPLYSDTFFSLPITTESGEPGPAVPPWAPSLLSLRGPLGWGLQMWLMGHIYSHLEFNLM